MDQTIGVLKEHSLHAYIKDYLADKEYQEIKIGSRYADVYKDNIIYEVQTRSFNNLRAKLDDFLPSYKVQIIYPICVNKLIYLYDDKGVLLKEQKSPKHENPFKLFIELYKIKSYLDNKNLSLRIIGLDVKEFRMPKERHYYKQQKYVRTDQVPNKILYDISLYNKEDIISLFDVPLANFTSKDFAKAYKYTVNKACTILNVLYSMNVLTREKIGRCYYYNINK